MKKIIENVIRNGGLPLSQISERIETMYLSGRITGEERLQLTELMHEKADPENERGDWKTLYEALAEKINALNDRISEIERKLGGSTEDGSESGNEYPSWEMWDGVNGGYAYGDIVIHNDKLWQNTLKGMKNVWEPGALGVDQRYWMEIEK